MERRRLGGRRRRSGRVRCGRSSIRRVLPLAVLTSGLGSLTSGLGSLTSGLPLGLGRVACRLVGLVVLLGRLAHGTAVIAVLATDGIGMGHRGDPLAVAVLLLVEGGIALRWRDFFTRGVFSRLLVSVLVGRFVGGFLGLLVTGGGHRGGLDGRAAGLRPGH